MEKTNHLQVLDLFTGMLITCAPSVLPFNSYYNIFDLSKQDLLFTPRLNLQYLWYDLLASAMTTNNYFPLTCLSDVIKYSAPFEDYV